MLLNTWHVLSTCRLESWHIHFWQLQMIRTSHVLFGLDQNDLKQQQQQHCLRGGGLDVLVAASFPFPGFNACVAPCQEKTQGVERPPWCAVPAKHRKVPKLQVSMLAGKKSQIPRLQASRSIPRKNLKFQGCRFQRRHSFAAHAKKDWALAKNRFRTKWWNSKPPTKRFALWKNCNLGLGDQMASHQLNAPRCGKNTILNVANP